MKANYSAELQAKMVKAIGFFLFAGSVTGWLALIWTFWQRSEARNAFLWGYSAARLMTGALTFFISGLFLGMAICWVRQTHLSQRWTEKWIAFFAKGDRPYFAYLAGWFLILIFAWATLFSWLFIPANLRPQLCWLLFLAILFTMLIRVVFSVSFQMEAYGKKYRLIPSVHSLSAKQKRIFVCLLLISVGYIALLMNSNLNGTENWEAFSRYGGDEYVIYPILMDVMAPGETFSAALYHRFIYEDYHYGYPFYALSTLVLTPVQWMTGERFPDQIGLNLPLLRVMVSVVPVSLSCLILVWLFTRFSNFWVSSATLIFLLFAPGTLQNNQGFWHPDGLNLFFVCLALYYLTRDHYRFGINFAAAAFFIGLSISTRLYGFFFVLAIAVYLLSGIGKKRISWRSAVVRGGGFILLMIVTVCLSSPYLFRADAREKMVAILNEKSTEMKEGYPGDYDPRNDYRPGWDAWYPAFEDHYTEMFCFFFLIASSLAASFWGSELSQLAHRIMLCWFVMITGYLVFFVAVKSTQYVLPALIPLMASMFSLPLVWRDKSSLPHGLNRKGYAIGAWILAGGIWAVQMVLNIIKILPRF